MIKKPINNNYCATVVKIKNIIQLENCDNVVHTNIFGNLVIISKDVKIGDIGLFFPVETKLSSEFLKYNNLYRKSELNLNNTIKGYFEENGRIRCVKFRGNVSQGFFIPLPDCLNNLFFVIKDQIDKNHLKIGTEFDELNGIKICEKYIPKQVNMLSSSQGKQRNKNFIKRFNVLIENQFKLHYDTSQLGKSIHRIKPDSLISITTKLHGTSHISSNILCKRKLNLFEKILKNCGIKIQDTEYKNIWSSRKVIKNQYVYSKEEKIPHYYSEDIWSFANNKLKQYLQKGMTIYAELVGYLSLGNQIQKGYDYGCQPGQFQTYIYRITFTNIDGQIHEFSAKEVQDWCIANGLKAVPELYYGYAKDLFQGIENYFDFPTNSKFNYEEYLKEWQRVFLLKLQEKYLEKDSVLNITPMPEEGVVLKIEGYNQECYKLKSNRFLELETKNLDSGEIDIEENQN